MRQLMKAEPNMKFRPKIRYWLPAAAMDEEDLRTEIRVLYERGFGGIEAVVLSLGSELAQIADREDRWGGKRWDHMIDVMAEETKRLGMTLDIAAGPGWPIASPVITSADDLAAICELTYGAMEVPGGYLYEGILPPPHIVRGEGTPHLVHALAYEKGMRRMLRLDSYLNLDSSVSAEGRLRVQIPGDSGQTWVIFAFYRQPAVHKINAGHSYVVDHLSRAGTEAVTRYWENVFTRQDLSSMESIFCDSLEYRTSMDWTPELPEEFRKRRGYSILPYLPFLGLDNVYPELDLTGYRADQPETIGMVSRDYMETLTQLYCEYHLSELEKMAERHGKTVRYQVAYNKMFDVVRCGLYVGIPENEALGRPSLDYQRTMAGAAHLGRKERYSFECAAEFGNTYGQNYEDLFWWVKRSLMAGMNAQVLHGASYSGKYEGVLSRDGNLPEVQWPGYEGFGKMVSNYWNRTLSPEHARGCMDAIARLNEVFQRQAKVDCAIFRSYYSSDGLGSEFCLYPDDGALSNRGYSYEFVSEELLALDVCRVTDGMLDADGAGYRCLIIPPMQDISTSAATRMKELAQAGLPVVWVGEKPKTPKFYGEWNTAEARYSWQNAIEALWEDVSVLHLDRLENVPSKLASANIRPRVELEGVSDLMTAVREDQEGTKYIALYRYNRVRCTPEDPNPAEFIVSALYRDTKSTYVRPGAGSKRTEQIRIFGEGKVLLCDYWTGRQRELDFASCGDGWMAGQVTLEEDEMTLLAVTPTDEAGIAGKQSSGGDQEVIPAKLTDLKLYSFEPDQEGERSFLRSGFMEEAIVPAKIEFGAWDDLDERLYRFAGKAIYRLSFAVDEIRNDARYILELGDVCDTFTVRVNDRDADFPDQVCKRVEITDLVRAGNNEIEICVVSNLYNRLVGPELAPIPYTHKRYGIMEKDGCVARIAVLNA